MIFKFDQTLISNFVGRIDRVVFCLMLFHLDDRINVQQKQTEGFIVNETLLVISFSQLNHSDD